MDDDEVDDRGLVGTPHVSDQDDTSARPNFASFCEGEDIRDCANDVVGVYEGSNEVVEELSRN